MTTKHCASTGFYILILLQPSCDMLAWLSEMMKPRTLAFTRVCMVTSKMRMLDCSNPSHSKSSEDMAIWKSLVRIGSGKTRPNNLRCFSIPLEITFYIEQLPDNNFRCFSGSSSSLIASISTNTAFSKEMIPVVNLWSVSVPSSARTTRPLQFHQKNSEWSHVDKYKCRALI